MVGVQNPGFPAEPVCQSGRGCCHPSARHTRACSHVSCGQGVPRGVKEKTSPRSLPSLQTETLWAGLTLSLTHCGLGGKDTHAPLFLSGETSQLQARKQILNTYVYKYTHTQKKKPYTHTRCSPAELIKHFWFILVPSVHYRIITRNRSPIWTHLPGPFRTTFPPK